MRKLLIIVLLLPAFCFGQDTLISYTYTHEINLTKDDLFGNAKRWIASNFNSYKNTINYEDKEAGEISGVGEFGFKSGMIFGAKYKYSISIREAKWRLKIDNIELKYFMDMHKAMFTSGIVSYQNELLDSLTSVKDSLDKVDDKSLKKSELKTLTANRYKTKKAISENLVLFIEPYFISFDKSLYGEMIKKDDF